MRIEFTTEKELKAKIKEFEKEEDRQTRHIAANWLAMEQTPGHSMYRPILNSYESQIVGCQDEYLDILSQKNAVKKQLAEFNALPISKKLENELVIQKAKLESLNNELNEAEKGLMPTRGINLGMCCTPTRYLGTLSNLSENMYHIACADIKRDILRTEKKIKTIEDILGVKLQPAK